VTELSERRLINRPAESHSGVRLVVDLHTNGAAVGLH